MKIKVKFPALNVYLKIAWMLINSFVIDEDIGKELLTSWKTMSLIEDDVMDFSFNTVSGGKKKEFDFDKL